MSLSFSTKCGFGLVVILSIWGQSIVAESTEQTCVVKAVGHSTSREFVALATLQGVGSVGGRVDRNSIDEIERYYQDVIGCVADVVTLADVIGKFDSFLVSCDIKLSGGNGSLEIVRVGVMGDREYYIGVYLFFQYDSSGKVLSLSCSTSLAGR